MTRSFKFAKLRNCNSIFRSFENSLCLVWAEILFLKFRGHFRIGKSFANRHFLNVFKTREIGIFVMRDNLADIG